MKKTIKDYDLEGKKVIIRVDFNVPIKDGIITDDNRIVESLGTINYAIEHGAKVILMSHLGRIKDESDKLKNTLKPVSIRLAQLINKEVIFVEETRGAKLEEAINRLNNGDVLLMENTRFEDLNGKKESKNDPELGVGIASHLPNGVGFLIETELTEFAKVTNNPNRPYTVILGGSKVSDKIEVIKNLVNTADHILIGGGMMFTFLKAQGYEVGKSLLEEDYLDFCREMLEKYPNKIVLPADCVCGKELSNDTNIRSCQISDIHEDEMGLDVSLLTFNLFNSYIDKSKTIVWNGPIGAFEYEKFADGTKVLCDVLSQLTQKGVTTIIGGGDTAAAAIQFGHKNSFTHISTGGGASLELLAGKELPGISIIKDK